MVVNPMMMGGAYPMMGGAMPYGMPGYGAMGYGGYGTDPRAAEYTQSTGRLAPNPVSFSAGVASEKAALERAEDWGFKGTLGGAITAGTAAFIYSGFNPVVGLLGAIAGGATAGFAANRIGTYTGRNDYLQKDLSDDGFQNASVEYFEQMKKYAEHWEGKARQEAALAQPRTEQPLR